MRSTIDNSTYIENATTRVSTSIGQRETEVIYQPTPIVVNQTSTTTALDSSTVLTEGDAVILESDGSLVKGTLGAITGTYQADISSFGLTLAPTKAWFDGHTPNVSIDVETTADRCVCRDMTLTKVSSTDTEFVGTSTQSGMLQTGDSVLFDDTNTVTTTDVAEVDNGDTTFNYTLTFPSQAQAPTTCVIPNRSTQLSVVTDVLTTGSVNTHDIFQDGSAVATYQLDGDATDLGGNYDGTATNVTYGTGKFGNAGVFNGSTSTISSSVSLTPEFSFSIWVKVIGTNTYSNAILFGNVQNGANISLAYGKPSGFVGLSDGINGYIDISSSLPDVSVWNNIIATYDSTTLIAYINSVQVGTYTGSVVINPNMYLSSPQQSDTYFNGSIDQVRIFNRALTQSEVTELYNESADYFKATYSDIALTGKGIQRKIVAPKADTIITEPFTTKIYK